MPFYKFLPIFLAIPFSIIGCAERDYYSEVQKACNEYPVQATIPQSCIDAVSALILPRLDETFFKPETAESVRTELIHAFAFIAYYPLKIPEKQGYLGYAPYSIPLWQLRTIEIWPDIRQSIFNVILNHIQKIKYLNQERIFTTAVAHFTVNCSLEGVMTISNSFFKRQIFSQAALILHEAIHGNGNFHLDCKNTGGCDAELNSAYGFQVTYHELLLNGSGSDQYKLEHKPAPSPFSDDVLEKISKNICSYFFIETKIVNYQSDLKKLVTDSNGCSTFPIEWIIEQENLVRKLSKKNE